MPDIIITPSTGKLEFIDNSAQVTRRHSFTLDHSDGLVLDAPLSAAAVIAPLNVINVTVNNSNVNYPFVLAQSGETGAKNLLMDGAGGTYNPFTNTATIDISGNSATATLASNSTNLGGVAAASYVTLTGTQTLTNKTITGTFTGNLTGTGSWATNAVSAISATTATNSTQLNGQAASYYTNIPARLGYTPVNKAGDTISGNLTVNGNFAVNGSVTAFSASNIYLTSSNLTVTDNILLMNALTPYQRYAGIQMYDSGSGTLSQFLWDGEGDYFFLTGSSVNGKIITGPDGQTNLSSNYVPKATAGYKLGNSLIYDNGTNIGIGTTSPGSKLDVVGAVKMPVIRQSTTLYDGTDITDDNSTRTVYFNIPEGGNNPSRYFKVARIKITGNYHNVSLNGYFTAISSGNHVGFERKVEFDFIAYAATNPAAPQVTYLKRGPDTTNVLVYSVPNGGGAGTTYYDVYIRSAWYNDTNGELAIRVGFSSAVTVWQAGLDSGTSAPVDTLVNPNSNYAFDTSGNVGIGTTSPGSKLDVVGSVRSFASAGNYGLITNGSFQAVGNHGGTFMLDLDNTGEADLVNIKKSGVSRFYIKNDGNIGIGTSSPTSKLHVVETTATGSRIQLGSISTNALMNTNLVNNFLILTAPFSAVPASVSNNNAKWGIKMGGGSTDAPNISGKSACIYAVSEEDIGAGGSGAGYNRKVGLALHTSPFDLPNVERVRINNLGNVGIGTTTPATKLDIYGPVSVRGTTVLTTNFDLNAGNAADIYGNIRVLRGASLNDGMYIGYGGAGGNLKFFSNSGTTEFMTIATTGNVGIGSTSPAALLNVRASAPTGIGSTPTGTNLLIDSNTSNYITFRNTADNGTYAGLIFLDNNVGGYIAFGNSGATAGSDSMIYGAYQDHIFQNGYVNETLYNRTETMRIKSSGYVGINTNNPTARLHVVQGNSGGVAAILLSSDESTIQGPSANTQIRMGGNLVLSAANISTISTNGSERVRIQSDGKVGVGTSSPNSTLTAFGDGSVNGYSGVIRVSDTAGPKWGAIGLPDTQTGTTSANNYYLIGRAGAYTDRALSLHIPNAADYGSGVQPKVGIYSTGSDLLFSAEASTGTIYAKGNVGISTTSPLARLHIVSSTAGSTVVRADGTSGTLFSVVDDLSDSLMSVNNSAGLPVFEVFADDRIVTGQYGTNDFVVVNNKVGIGTNNPANKLTVSGSTSIGESYINTTAPSNGLIVQGNVGIGITSFTCKLAILGEVQISSNSAYTTHLNYGDSGVNFITMANGGYTDFRGSSNNVTTMRVKGDGNVGIGTTAPATTLHVVGVISGSSFNGAGTGLTGTASSLSIGGNATTATTLQTARNINGTSFNGSAAITTATWGTARTLTIGSTGKSVDGSAAVSWSLAEIGAAATNQTMFIGTTSVAINRASAGQTLTGVSIDGNAATVTNGVYTNTNNTLTGINTINNTSNTVINNQSGNLGLTMYQATAGTDAYMTFHIGGDYAAYLGLGGAENDLVYGGWSAGNNRRRILHSGNAAYAWNMNQYVRTTDSPTFGTLQLTRLNFGATGAAPYNSAAGEGIGNGITFGGDEDGPGYRIFTTMENVGGNYSKLVINWHTGIRIGAYTNYGGIRFYNNAFGAGNPTPSEIFSIGNTDSNVRVVNNLIVNGITINQERSTNARMYGASVGSMGLLGVDSAGSFRWQIYGDASNYGFLDSTWGNWDIQKAVNGQLDLRVSGATVRVLNSGNAAYAYNMNQNVRTTDTCSFAGLTVSNTINGSVTGNAGTVTNATFYRQFTVRDDRSDGGDYSLAARPTGLYAINAAGTNGPGATYLSLIHVANGSDVAFQIAGGYLSDNMYFRGTYALQNGTGYSAWRTVIHSGNIGSQTVATAGSCTGNAATATTTDNINGRAFFNRNSGNSLAQDSYTNNGIGYVTGVSLFSQTDGGMHASAYDTSWIHQIYGDFRTGQIAIRGKNSGTWQAWRTVLDSTNASFAWNMNQNVRTTDTCSFAGLTVSNTINGSVTGNAVTAGGLAVHTGTNNEANKIVRTQANGYIMAGWINTISGDNGTTAIDRIYASSDGYIRYYTPANFRTVLDVPTRGGSGASGNWAINITGNAATATNGFTSKPGWAGNTNLIQSLPNFNNSVPSGFYEYSSATNSPSATWYNLINVRHSNTGNDHGFQLAMSYYDNNLWFRSYQGGTGANNGTFQSWAKTLSNQNYTDYTVTKTGTGASGTWAINITGNAATATSATSATTAGALTTGNTYTIAGLTSNGTINIFPPYASSYSYFLRMGYDNSGNYDYTVKRNGTTGFLEFSGTQTNYVAYHFAVSGASGIGIGVSPAARLHINGDGTNPPIRIDNPALGSGASNSRGFYGWLPISIGGVGTKYIQLYN